MDKDLYSSVSILRELQHDLYEIARRAELGDSRSLVKIQARAEASLRLIDSYMLATQLERGQAKLDLKPFAVGSVMHDAAHEIQTINGSNISVKTGVNKPVTTNPELLKNLILSMGNFIGGHTNRPMLMRSFEDKAGRVGLGVFTRDFDVTQKELDKALSSVGESQMLLPKESISSGVLLSLSDKIASALDTKLMVKRLGRQKGFMISLPQSQQLSLVRE